MKDNKKILIYLNYFKSCTDCDSDYSINNEAINIFIILSLYFLLSDTVFITILNILQYYTLVLNNIANFFSSYLIIKSASNTKLLFI